MKTLYDFSLADLTPKLIADDLTVSALITAITPQLQLISHDISHASIIPRIYELDEISLDFLAAQFHVDAYDLAGTLDLKREAVQNSLLLHMHKGTSWAIIEGLRQIGIDAQFLHWHDTGDPPYTFRLKAEISGNWYKTQGRDGLIERIKRVVDQNKSARSLLLGLDTSIHENENIALYTALIDFMSGYELLALPKPEAPAKSFLFSGTVFSQQGSHIITPERDKLIVNPVNTGIITTEFRSLEIGADLSLMNELLLQFEKRIMDALKLQEMNINAKINESNNYMSSRFNDLEDLLRWKGEDEDFE